jgi:hypothetical protein
LALPYDIKTTILGLNALLTDLYDKKRHICEILLSYDFSPHQIEKLKTENLYNFYDNIKYALYCRFLHYADGQRLLLILFRKYGLFGYKNETLQEIGDSLLISRERVRQLEQKAIKRLKGGVSADSVAILLLIAACMTLGINATDMMKIADENNKECEKILPNYSVQAPVNVPGLPEANFYIQGSFDYSSKRGYYQLLMEFRNHKKYFKKRNIEGHSDVMTILLAVIEGLDKLTKPCLVTVYSNTIFGLSSIYNKKGILREEVPLKAVNYDLKAKIRNEISENGHSLKNIGDNTVRNRFDDVKRQKFNND